jgi:hypothetical protein
MAPIATIVPGASYASGVYTIPVTALNSAMLRSFTANGSFEQLAYALLEILYEKYQAGALAQYQVAAEVSNKVIQSSIFEKTQNVFSNCTLVSMLTSFCFETTATTAESATNISSIG